MSGRGVGGVAAVAHVLLAEFDIEEGSKVSFQYPTPTGTEAKYRPQRQPWTVVTAQGLTYTRTRISALWLPRPCIAQCARRADAAGRGAQPRPRLDGLRPQPDSTCRGTRPPTGPPQPTGAEGGVCGGWRGSSPSGHRPSSQRPPAPQQQCRLALHVHTPPRPPCRSHALAALWRSNVTQACAMRRIRLPIHEPQARYVSQGGGAPCDLRTELMPPSRPLDRPILRRQNGCCKATTPRPSPFQPMQSR